MENKIVFQLVKLKYVMLRWDGDPFSVPALYTCLHFFLFFFVLYLISFRTRGDTPYAHTHTPTHTHTPPHTHAPTHTRTHAHVVGVLACEEALPKCQLN